MSMDELPLWLTVAAAALTLACAVAASRMRAHFALATAVFGCAACSALCALALGAAGVALAVIAAGAGFSVLSMVGASLLTTRSSRKAPLGARVYLLALGVLLLAALLWSAPEVGVRTMAVQAITATEALLLAGVALAGGAAAFALLGVGERSVFDNPREEE